MLRPTPRVATWFLNQFGPASEEESELGDLVEQYQRGHGRLWYRRQVLSIVFGTLLRTARENKRSFFTGLLHTYLVWIGLQIMEGTLLLLIDFFRNLETSQYFSSGAGGVEVSLPYPFGTSLSFQGPVPILLLTIALRVLTPLAVGYYCSRSAKVHPRSILLAFVVMFVIVNLGLIAISSVFIGDYSSDAGATAIFLIKISISLIVTCALILFGGMRGQRGLSPLSLKR